jgi:hypothetical protein
MRQRLCGRAGTEHHDKTNLLGNHGFLADGLTLASAVLDRRRFKQLTNTMT